MMMPIAVHAEQYVAMAKHVSMVCALVPMMVF